MEPSRRHAWESLPTSKRTQTTGVDGHGLDGLGTTSQNVMESRLSTIGSVTRSWKLASSSLDGLGWS